MVTLYICGVDMIKKRNWHFTPPTQAFDLWIDEFMTFWRGCPNSPHWEQNLIYLYSRLAWNNVGHIDWSEYAPMFFSRLLANFNLPINLKYVM